MRKGFTLLELLIASALLGVIVMILTSIFSASSTAWSVGIAGVADLSESRRTIAKYERSANEVLSDQLALQDVIDVASGTPRSRAVKTGSSEFKITDPKGWNGMSVNSANVRSVTDYVVGVMSLGPDGEYDTWDDVNTWPTEE